MELCLQMDGEKTKTLWVKIKQVTLYWGSATGHQTKKTEQMKPLQTYVSSSHICSCALIHVGDLNDTRICRADNTTWRNNAEVSWTVLLITSFSK